MPRTNQALVSAKQDPADYVSFFSQRSSSSLATIRPGDLAGKHILDVGSGLGANLVYLCQNGAARVTALDIETEQLRCAQNILARHHPEYAQRVEFLTADAARMPFEDQCFDTLVSADTFEHINDLQNTLLECFRVLRTGGRLYIFFPPYYSPWGAHMINWIRLPWCQVVFSEPTIVRVARHIEKDQAAVNNLLPPETRLDLQDGDAIPFISHLTLRHFSAVLRALPQWKIVTAQFLPIGWRSRHPISYLVKPLTQIPYIQEAITSRAVYILEK